MLLKITNSCSMGCNHCLSNCKPCEEHMNLSTLYASLDFINRYKVICVLITGGEPTEHPNFLEFINIIKNYKFNHFVHFIITTNGEWILNNKEKAKNIVKHEGSLPLMSWQITTDKRFYPRQIDRNDSIWNEEGFTLCKDLVQKVYPLGRALSNKNFDKYSCSQCYNPRSLANQGLTSFYDVIEALQAKMKFCEPQIMYDGSIALGESNLCKPIGTIYDTDEFLFNATKNFKHKQCDWINKQLPDAFKKLILFE